MFKCEKVCYRTRVEAKKKLKFLKKKKGSGEKALYYCSICSSYHLTSISKDESKLIQFKDQG